MELFFERVQTTNCTKQFYVLFLGTMTSPSFERRVEFRILTTVFKYWKRLAPFYLNVMFIHALYNYKLDRKWHWNKKRTKKYVNSQPKDMK